VTKPGQIEISGQGNETRDFIYVKDVVRACFLALEKIDRYEAFNIAAGKSITINDLLGMIMRIENVNARVVHGQSRPQSEIRRAFDNKKAAELLGFTAETSIEEGLKKTIDWYKKNLAPQN
jgi:nucleoside-diphosphate-sugar epimerase